MTADAIVVGAGAAGMGRHHPPAGAGQEGRARGEDLPHRRLHLRLGRQPGRDLQRPAGRGRRLRRLPPSHDRGLPGQRRRHVRARAHRALRQQRGRDHQLAQHLLRRRVQHGGAACTTWPSTATTASLPTPTGGAGRLHQPAVPRWRASGAEVLLDTSIQSITMTDGAVSGIVATGKDGTTYNIAAPAVILTTGGYGASSRVAARVAGRLALLRPDHLHR